MGDAGTKLRELWNGLEPKGQLTVIGAAVGVIAVFYLLFSVTSQPSYQTLLTGVDPSETAEISKALDGAGIGYQLKNGGTEIDVKSGTQSQAEVALASKGLPKGSHVGFEIFDKQSLGQTQFQQQVDYQRALEGEIARTIEQIDGVTSAQVQLVLPQDTLFADSSSKASASILLSTPQTLDATTVSGIAHLVAGSVKGLAPSDVTITDGTGTMLWPTSAAAGGFSATAKLQADEQYGTQLSSAIDAMLAQTLGAGKAQARVHVDLNVDQTSIDKVTYAKKGVPLTQSSDRERLNSKGGGTTPQPAGTASNVPSYAAGVAGTNSTSNYQHTVDTTQYGIDRTVQRTTVAPGSVNRMDVALLLDQSVPAAQVNSIKASVASMAGLVPRRGDTITVSRFAFAKPPAATAAAVKKGPLANPIGMARYVALGLGALVFLFLMRRGIRRREGEALAPEPVWLREIETPVPVAEIEQPKVTPAHQRALAEAHERRQQERQEVESIVRREPDQIAGQVGQWLKE